MAAFTLGVIDTAHPGRLEAVLATLREMLDAFVSYRLRLAAAEAGHAGPRHAGSSSSRNRR